jgi:hypothetical protein
VGTTRQFRATIAGQIAHKRGPAGEFRGEEQEDRAFGGALLNRVIAGEGGADSCMPSYGTITEPSRG